MLIKYSLTAVNLIGSTAGSLGINRHQPQNMSAKLLKNFFFLRFSDAFLKRSYLNDLYLRP